MKKFRFFSVIFGLLGLLCAGAGVFLALSSRDAAPVLVEQPEAARNQVVTMLDALTGQDYDAVSACLYGQPDLGLNRQPEDPVGQLMWQAFAGSVQYELVGQFYATDSGVAQKVVITALDFDSMTENLRQRSQTLLEQRVAQAVDTSDIYDENNEYREEFVLEVLYDAARQAVEQDAQARSWEVSLNLIYENGQWWIMPEQELLSAISGGILG